MKEGAVDPLNGRILSDGGYWNSW